MMNENIRESGSGFIIILIILWTGFMDWGQNLGVFFLVIGGIDFLLTLSIFSLKQDFEALDAVDKQRLQAIIKKDVLTA